MLDVNSLYPYVMYTCELPFGYPVFFEGEYQNDKIYPLYIQQFTCTFKLKQNKIPCIQIKGGYFRSNEYLENSGLEPVTLTMTNVDLKLFLEQYDVDIIEFKGGYKFKSTSHLFTEYIDKWIKRKNDATLEKNEGVRTVSKLMLNSLYGKLAKAIEIKCKHPYLAENGIIKYYLGELEDTKGIYIPGRVFHYSLCKRQNY